MIKIFRGVVDWEGGSSEGCLSGGWGQEKIIGNFLLAWWGSLRDLSKNILKG